MGLRRVLRHALDRDFRPVFLTGVAGSGTTLSSSLLDQHFKVAAALHESAREAPKESPLYMKNIEWHDSVPQYYRHLFFPAHTGARDVRAWSLRLYRDSARYPKASNVVLDKAPNSHLVRMKLFHQAFPDSPVLLVFRDPVSNIEGLRRKWPQLFGRATIDELCDFWEGLHLRFEDDVADFEHLVRRYAYEDMVVAPEAWMKESAAFCGLEPRAEPRQYKDKANSPGKGLRNVSDGMIRVDAGAARGREALAPREAERIRVRLMPLFEMLKDRARTPRPRAAAQSPSATRNESQSCMLP